MVIPYFGKNGRIAAILKINFFTYYIYLPPANEVWGKVIFSVACVKNSVHRGGGGGIPTCIADGIPACLVVGGGIPACLAGLQAHTQWGS